MEKSVLKRLTQEIRSGIKENKKTIDKVLNEELSKGNPINIERVTDIIKEYDDIAQVDIPENTSIAVCYSGKPEITMAYILDSIIYNNNITLCVNEYKAITEVLVKIVTESLKQMGIRNNWIDYKSNYNEIYLRDNQDDYQKIIYIGDFFEYEKFKYFFKKDVEYNNFGYIKLFIDKVKYKEEYKKITKYAYMENIFLEVYNDAEDFISESREQDYSIIMAEMDVVNKIKRELRSGELLINAFPYDDYKFRIER